MKLLPQVLQEKQILEPDHRVLLWLGDKGIEQKSYTYRQVSICGACVAILLKFTFANLFLYTGAFGCTRMSIKAKPPA